VRPFTDVIFAGPKPTSPTSSTTPGLTLLAAGHDLGFSLRYLHELFREADTTPRA
jgi:hypothetical protein